MDDVAVAITTVGSVLAVLVSGIGLFLRHSIDMRNAALTELAQNRASQEHEEAAARLQLDTAIDALGLLKTADGSPASAATQAGTLFALSDLGNHDFSLTLLEQLWPTEGVAAPTATYVIERGLGSADEGTQRRAADVLDANAERLVYGGTLQRPRQLYQAWAPDVELSARYTLLRAFSRAVVSRPWEDWERTELNSVIGTAYTIFRVDSDPGVRVDARRLMLAVLQKTHPKRRPVIRHFGERFDLGEVESEVKQVDLKARGSAQLRQRLDGWLKEAPKAKEPD